MKIIGLSVFITYDNTKLYTVCILENENNKYTIDQDNNKTRVTKFPLIHYRVKPYRDIEEVFDFSNNYINLDYFILKHRFKEIKRKVWIFKGESLLGKTFLSDNMNLSKYETDSSAELPSIIIDDIIVLGNKYKFSLEDIVSRIPNKDNTEIITVDFNSLL